MDLNYDMATGADPDEEMEPIFSTLSPGDKGFNISHARGEHHVFNDFAEDMDQVTSLYVQFRDVINAINTFCSKHIDDQIPCNQIEACNKDWIQ